MLILGQARSQQCTGECRPTAMQALGSHGVRGSFQFYYMATVYRYDTCSGNRIETEGQRLSEGQIRARSNRRTELRNWDLMVLYFTLEIIRGTTHDYLGMGTWGIDDVDPIHGRGSRYLRLSFMIHNILAHDPRANLHTLAMDHNVRVCE